MPAYFETDSAETRGMSQNALLEETRRSKDHHISDQPSPQFVTHVEKHDSFQLQAGEGGLSFHIVADLPSLVELEEDWNLLFKRAGKPHQVFQTFNWCWHWCHHFLGPENNINGSGLPNDACDDSKPSVLLHLKSKTDMFVVVAYQHDKLILVWPLLRETILGISRLTWLGRPITQYGDVIVEDIKNKSEVLRLAWEYIKEHAKVDVVQFSLVRDDSDISKVLAKAGYRITDRSRAPYLNLETVSSVDDYFKTKNARAAKNRRRCRRRLGELGKLSFKVHCSDAKAGEISLKALQMKRAWLKKKGCISRALSDVRTDRFFHDVCAGEVRNVESRVSQLCVDGREVAVEIGFSCKGALAVHVIVYDDAYYRYGCGSLAMEDSVRACWNDGVRVYDLLAPDTPYKFAWADQSVGIKNWSLPMTFKGRVWLWLYTVMGKKCLKNTLKRLPVALSRPATCFLNLMFERIGA